MLFAEGTGRISSHPPHTPNTSLQPLPLCDPFGSAHPNLKFPTFNTLLWQRAYITPETAPIQASSDLCPAEL